MSISKIIAVAAMAIFLAAPVRAQETGTKELTNNNGIAAGKALLSLYTQYKADGKLDLSKASNITNIITIVNNIKGLTKNSTVKDFLSGLVSGSKNLVNDSNSGSVISALTSIAGVDANSIASTAVSNAAKGVISKLGIKGKASTQEPNSSATTVANALTNLFSGLSY